MISLLCPTRGRTNNVQRLIDSISKTSLLEKELLLYVDEDDNSYNFPMPEWVRKHTGKRILPSQAWNFLSTVAKFDIVGLVGDDVLFYPEGWDKLVVEAFNRFEDKICYVHGDEEGYGAHGFVHKNWINAVGRFVREFPSGYVDNWLNDMANIVNRRVYIPITIDHLHVLNGRAENDDTYISVMSMRSEGMMLYGTWKGQGLLEEDARKLREAMHDHSNITIPRMRYV